MRLLLAALHFHFRLDTFYFSEFSHNFGLALLLILHPSVDQLDWQSIEHLF